MMEKPYDQATFQQAFLGFKNDLHAFLLRIVGHKEDADDLLQDTYIKAASHIQSFLGRSSLKTWVFTIASNLARDHFRARKRWSEEAQENARRDAYANPEKVEVMAKLSEESEYGRFEVREHIDFCFTCMAKTLPIENQLAVILKDIYEFKVSEIMEILSLTEGKVKHAIADGRSLLMDIFDRKCALVSKKGACHQCSELNQIFNPKQNQQETLRKLEMYQEFKNGKRKDHLYRLRAELVQQINPIEAEGVDLHNYFLSLMPAYSESAAK